LPCKARHVSKKSHCYLAPHPHTLQKGTPTGQPPTTYLNRLEIILEKIVRYENMTATIGEYKGHKTLSLVEDGAAPSDKYPPFSFGVKKAKLILAHINEIQKFVDENP
jgi:hypothetical protein